MSAKSNRTKGRQAEFAAREAISKVFDIHPDGVLLRAKGANGCDVWPAAYVKSKFPFSVEVKNRQRIPYYEVLEQMTKNTEKGTFPVAFILNEKLGHSVMLPMDAFLAIVKLLEDSDWFEKAEKLLDYCKSSFPKIRDGRAYIKESKPC